MAIGSQSIGSRPVASLNNFGAGAPAYNAATDVRGLRSQSKVFGEPGTFVKAAGIVLVTLLTSYVAIDARASHRSDVTRTTQVQTAQKSKIVTTLTTYTAGYDSTVEPREPQAKVFGEPERFVQPQGRSRPITDYGNIELYDLLSGQDSTGWPTPEVPWFSAQPARLVSTLTTYVAGYDSAVEPREPQAKVFGQPESFVQPQKNYLRPPYDFAAELREAQAKAFGQPESFVRTLPANIVGLTAYAAYDPTTDVRRLAQAKIFGQPESFVQAQGRSRPVTDYGNIELYDLLSGQDVVGWPTPEVPWFSAQSPRLVSTLTTYAPGYNSTVESRKSQTKVFGQPESFVQPRELTRLVTDQTVLEAYDPLISGELFGWPDQTQAWAQAQRSALLTALTTYVPYNSTVEPRRPQAKIFGQPEVFAQAQRQTLVAILTTYAPYDPSVEPREPQAKIFGQPEVFAKRQNVYPFAVNAPFVAADDGKFGRNKVAFVGPESFIQPQTPAFVSVITPYVPYDPATDVVRRGYAKIFSGSEEVFDWTQWAVLDIEVITPPVIPPGVNPGNQNAAGGGGGRKHIGWDADDDACKRKKEKELEEELRALYREVASGEVASLAKRVEDIVEPMLCDSCQCKLTKTDVIDVAARAKAIEIDKVTPDGEIALRMAHDELQAKRAQREENMRRIQILLRAM